MANRRKKATKANAKKKTKGKRMAAKTMSRAPAKPKQKAARPAKLTPSAKPRTKSEIMAVLADQTGMSKKDVGQVFDTLAEVMRKDLGNRGCGIFTVPGLMKVRRINKPATKARQGVNPFTGEETIFKAKPARNVVRVRPLKALKDMV